MFQVPSVNSSTVHSVAEIRALPICMVNTETYAPRVRYPDSYPFLVDCFPPLNLCAPLSPVAANNAMVRKRISENNPS